MICHGIKKIASIWTTLFLLGYFSLGFAAPHKSHINILSWWGYLNHPEIITRTEQACNVVLSFDQYFSNDEFLRRWQGQQDNYDIIIFSDTIYNVIKDKLPNIPESTLWKHANTYHPTIKKHYFQSNYPHNVVYFIHSLTGFLWNPQNVQLSKDDEITTIFAKSKEKLVVIIDDPVEAFKLIESSFSKGKKLNADEILTIKNFKRVMQNPNVYITNNYSKIYKKPTFGFSFTWSGEAVLDLIESNENYKFLIHPKLSYVSSDLITQTTNRRGALCVAEYLSQKETLKELQEKYFYFSPYADYETIKNPFYKGIYEDFLISLPNLTWIDSINKKDFEKINKAWQLIKINLNNHINGN